MADPFLLHADAPLWPDELPPSAAVTPTRVLAGIVFAVCGVPEDCDAAGLNLQLGDRVLVETSTGHVEGRVIIGPRAVKPGAGRLRKVARKVSPQDDRSAEALAAREKAAFVFCLQRIRELKLDMKLVKAEGQTGGGKMVFFFASDDRVDFRELVSALAKHLKSRVEMRQIGVRDAAKSVGGIGICGRELCCTSWMKGFVPVSIKMAKDQGLALNPQKVSGQCGRLLCCLTYEQDTYKALRAGLPKVGKPFVSADGRSGKVRDVDVLRGKVRVWFDTGVEELTREEVQRLATSQASVARSDDVTGSTREKVSETAGPTGPSKKP